MQSTTPAHAPTTAVRLDHTAVLAPGPAAVGGFLAAVLGLTVGAPFRPFLPVDLGNGVTLDYYEERGAAPIQSQHYAFLVPEERFDTALARLEALGVTYYADPHHSDPGRINRLFGGRGAASPTRPATTWRSRPALTSVP